jgi:hypothetical protein
LTSGGSAAEGGERAELLNVREALEEITTADSQISSLEIEASMSESIILRLPVV